MNISIKPLNRNALYYRQLSGGFLFVYSAYNQILNNLNYKLNKIYHWTLGLGYILNPFLVIFYILQFFSKKLLPVLWEITYTEYQADFGGVNERAVRAYMLSQDASVAEAIEKLRENPDKRVDLDQVVAAKE